LVEKEASRRMRRAAAVKAAAAAGGLGAGVKTFAAEAAKAVGLRYRTNRRKYGRVAAAVMEAVALGLSVTKKAKSFLLNVPLLSVALKPIAAVVGTLANAATRGALNFLGKRLLAKREVKRNPDAPGRVAQRMDKGKPVALPTAVVSRARDIRRGTGPGDLVPTNGATTSRSRRFAEAYPDADIDPVEFVTDLRGFVEQIVGGPLDVADGELAEVVEATVGLLEARAAGRA
jgi:hypothetical protein